MKNKPLVSIVVPNWNGGKKILRCLKSVSSLDYPKKEVIIVDNGSTDGTKEKIKKSFKKFKIIENKENLGCVKAINQGFSKAKGDYILRLDDDVVLPKDMLSKLMKTIRSSDSIGIVIPKVYYYSHQKVLCNIGFSINPLTGKTNAPGLDEQDTGKYESEREVDYVPGAILLTKKQVIKKAGLLDTDYFLYYEDADWCKKVRKAGYRIIYTPTAKAWHDCKQQTELNDFRIYHYIKSKLMFMKKNNSILANVFFFPFFFLIYTPARFAKFISSGKSNLIKSYIKGIKDAIF